MTMADLRDCLSDPAYVLMSRREAKELGFGPHEVAVNRTAQRAVVLTVKSEVGDDYSCNAGVVPAGVELISSRKFREVYIGQVDPDNPEELLAWDTVRNVQRYINGVEPRDGKFGEYYFLQAHTFRPSGSGSATRMHASIRRAAYGLVR